MFKFCVVILGFMCTVPRISECEQNPYYYNPDDPSSYSDFDGFYYPVPNQVMNPPDELLDRDSSVSGYQQPSPTTTDSYANVQETTTKNPDQDKYKFYFPAVLVFFKCFLGVILLLLARMTLFRNLGVVGSNIKPQHRSNSLGSALDDFLEAQINKAWSRLRNGEIFQDS